MDRPRLWRLLAVLLGLALAGYALVQLIDTVRLATATPPVHSDFHAIWSYARIAVADGGAAVYDQAHLWRSELAWGRDPSRPSPLPFAYPPHFLLLIAPLAWLDYAPAYLAWMLVTAGLSVVAVAGVRARGLLVLLAPAAVATMTYGQSGFLAAALIVGGMRVVPTRPVLAGMLLGLATYKPQLGLLVPVALVALGQWRVIGVAALTVVGLIGVTSALWGWGVWGAWIGVLPGYSARFDAEMGPYWYLVPTVEGTLRGLGVASGIAKLVQIMVALPATGAVWWLFRRAPYRLALAGLLVGTFLVTPHGFIYDLPLASSAIWLLLVVPAADQRLVIGAALLAGLMPALVLAAPALAPTAVLVHAVLFGAILWAGAAAKSVA